MRKCAEYLKRLLDIEKVCKKLRKPGKFYFRLSSKIQGSVIKFQNFCKSLGKSEKNENVYKNL
jgi:hypothetical protein